MATTDILPFCTATPGAANCLTPSAYAALTSILADGFVAGTALSIQINTVLRQSSFMAAGLANWLVSQGISVPDNGNMANLVAEITAGMNAFIANNGLGASYASNATTQSGTSTTQSVTPASLAASVFGGGGVSPQLWSQRSSPAVATAYQNTGSRLRAVSVSAGSSGNMLFWVSSTSTLTAGIEVGVLNLSTYINTFFTVVPPGYYYGFSTSFGTISNWVEF